MGLAAHHRSGASRQQHRYLIGGGNVVHSMMLEDVEQVADAGTSLSRHTRDSEHITSA